MVVVAVVVVVASDGVVVAAAVAWVVAFVRFEELCAVEPSAT